MRPYSVACNVNLVSIVQSVMASRQAINILYLHGYTIGPSEY